MVKSYVIYHTASHKLATAERNRWKAKGYHPHLRRTKKGYSVLMPK